MIIAFHGRRKAARTVYERLSGDFQRPDEPADHLGKACPRLLVSPSVPRTSSFRIESGVLGL